MECAEVLLNTKCFWGELAVDDEIFYDGRLRKNPRNSSGEKITNSETPRYSVCEQHAGSYLKKDSPMYTCNQKDQKPINQSRQRGLE